MHAGVQWVDFELDRIVGDLPIDVDRVGSSGELNGLEHERISAQAVDARSRLRELDTVYRDAIETGSATTLTGRESRGEADPDLDLLPCLERRADREEGLPILLVGGARGIFHEILERVTAAIGSLVGTALGDPGIARRERDLEARVFSDDDVTRDTAIPKRVKTAFESQAERVRVDEKVLFPIERVVRKRDVDVGRSVFGDDFVVRHFHRDGVPIGFDDLHGDVGVRVRELTLNALDTHVFSLCLSCPVPEGTREIFSLCDLDSRS